MMAIEYRTDASRPENSWKVHMPKNRAGPNSIMDVARRPLVSENRPDLEVAASESSIRNLKAHLHTEALDLRLKLDAKRGL